MFAHPALFDKQLELSRKINMIRMSLQGTHIEIKSSTEAIKEIAR